MATTNPLHDTHPPTDPTVSSRIIPIAGILVTIHGLAELPATASSVASLWLLHPRLQTKETMAPLAAQVIHAWNANNPAKGLIAVSFDQRNHGSRQVDKLHNEAWRQGNPRHAQDMFSCYHGTATDVSQLITHLESYIFSAAAGPRITQHLVLGVSLGGHAAWHCILSDPRVTAAVVGIGCPDYTRLMTDRARLSRLKSYVDTMPQGSAFLGSPDFPQALLDAIAKFDPAGLLLPQSFDPASPSKLSPEPDAVKLDRCRALMRTRLRGKRILLLSGKVDRLVPYAAGEPFLGVFKQLIREDPSLDIGLDDVLFEGVGHAFPKAMADKATSWICALLADGNEATVTSTTSSKI
jgi:pimeloyl-ACP methyl ester carboxylesterase